MKELNRILRSPDMVEETDPLDTPCNDIDTSFPLIPGSNYELEVTKAEVVPTKKDESRNNLQLTFTNVSEIISTKGESLAARSLTLIKRVSISPTPDYPIEKIKRSVGSIGKGCDKGHLTPKQIINDPTVLVGGIGIWKVKLKKETSEFPAGNDVGDPVVKE